MVGIPEMPSVKIIIPTALRQYAGNEDAVDVKAETVQEAMGDLVGRFDQLRRHLYADDGRLRNFVNVYVNEEDIRHRRWIVLPHGPSRIETQGRPFAL